MSDRLSEYKHILDDAAEVSSLWSSMKAALERCKSKIENLRGELAWVQDPGTAASILNHIRFMDYTAHQYQIQIERFPTKLAEIR